MAQIVSLGKTDLSVSALGLGTWQWGDTSMWQYGQGYSQSDVEAAYRASRDAGITFFDTAEIYGRGKSEQILGPLVLPERSQVVIASKFAPWPYRLTPRSLGKALDATLKRLKLVQIDLYQIHWPHGRMMSIDTLMNAMADQVESGKIRAVGVSNFSAKQMEQAHATLAKRGLPLASNQVQYSLLHRAPEENGVLQACRDMDVRLIAYSPLAKGVLTGKYHAENIKVTGQRKRFVKAFKPAALQASAPLIELLGKIGAARGDKTPSQVALNWLMRQGALPIPGAKNANQAKSNAGALGWELTDEEVEEISALARKINF